MEQTSNYTLGIIGGMGPMATAAFMEKIIKNTKADTDQEHMPMIVYHLPRVPDRTAYILGKSDESPVPFIIEAAQNLEKAGVTEIAIPCVTAHRFRKEIQAAVSVPLLDGVEDTAKYLSHRHIKNAGIMATAGTVKADLFGNAFKTCGMECVYPDVDRQTLVMEFIYDCIKSGKPVDEKKLGEVTTYLSECGADVIVLGCTELSLIPKELFSCETVDVLDVLAQTCIDHRNHNRG